MRKMFTFELFSPTKLRQLQYIKEEEVDEVMRGQVADGAAVRVAAVFGVHPVEDKDFLGRLGERTEGTEIGVMNFTPVGARP